MHRRHFLATAAVLAGRAAAEPAPADPARAYLRRLIRTRPQVEDFITPDQTAERRSRNRGWVHDAELGWVLTDSVRPDGVDGSKTFYHYEADGARKAVNFPGRPCRLRTYGNSFTHGDQVSDGETWQEYLAAHLREPVRNYGVGGYSVYQAYRRLRRVEQKHPGGYVVLNVYDDDHYRNLDAWRSIRAGRYSMCGYTLPHLRVDVAKGVCEPVDNLLAKPADAYRLCDEDFVVRTFKDAPVLRVVLALADKGRRAQELSDAVAAGFGIPKDRFTDADPVARVRNAHAAAALYATRHVLTWAEEFCAQAGKKFLLVLSFSTDRLIAGLEGKPPFDQELLDWLKGKPYPVIDMREAFRAEYQKWKPNVRAFVTKYYNSHHSPAGNFFTAWALRRHMVRWLDPKPLPYR